METGNSNRPLTRLRNRTPPGPVGRGWHAGRREGLLTRGVGVVPSVSLPKENKHLPLLLNTLPQRDLTAHPWAAGLARPLSLTPA